MKKMLGDFFRKTIHLFLTFLIIVNSLGLNGLTKEVQAAQSDILDNSQSIGMKFTGSYKGDSTYTYSLDYHIKKLKNSGRYTLCLAPNLRTVDKATFESDGSKPNLTINVDAIPSLSDVERSILKQYQNNGNNLANLLVSLGYEIKQDNSEAYMAAQLFIWEALPEFYINTVTYLTGGDALSNVRQTQTALARRAVAYILGPDITQLEINTLIASATGNTITLTKDAFNYYTVSGNGASISGNKLTINLSEVTTGEYVFEWDSNKIIVGDFERWNPTIDADGNDVSKTQPVVSFGAKPIEHKLKFVFQPTFAVQGTTVSLTKAFTGEKLSDQVTISTENGMEWPRILGTSTPVTAKFNIDWYFSEKNYMNQKFDVNALPADVIKLPNTDSFTVNKPGTQTITSINIPDKQGFYYPVLKLDKSKQETPRAFEKDFQARFNEENERTEVKERFAVKGTTTSKVKAKEGEHLEDTVDIALTKGNWPAIIETANKVPVTFQIDWYYSKTDYKNQQLDVNSLPKDISFIGSDTKKVTNTGQYTITSKYQSIGSGFYYPVLKIVLADQEYSEYFFNGFQAPFNDVGEKILTPWKPEVKTKTTRVQLDPKGGKVADKLTVANNKEGHEIAITSKLLGPFLTKPEFIKNGNHHEGGSLNIPSNAKVVGTVKTKIQGNGTVTTPEIEVTEKGWYVWVEEIAETTYSEPWYSNFGSEDEYVVVPWLPNIETTVSDASAERGAQVYDSITVLDLPGLWGLPVDGKGDTDKWGLKNPELVGKDRDPNKDGSYNLPDGFGKGNDKDLEATFTMYYSPTKPVRGNVPANAKVFDVVRAPLLQGTLKTTEFKAFDKAGWYTIVVSGGSEEGRLAKFQTEYGIPSETIHVPQGSEEEYYTQVNEENTFIGQPVYDALYVSKSLQTDDAQVIFTLYKYSDKTNHFDYSQPKEIAKMTKGMAIKKFGEYKSNTKGYGLEDLRIFEAGTYGWVAKVVDTKTKEIIYEGKHGEVGEVFNVEKLTLHTKASLNDSYLGEPIYDTVILENTVPDGYYVIVDLYKFSDKINDFSNAQNATEQDIVWTSNKIKVSASGEYRTTSYKPEEIGSYGFVEKLYDEKGNLLHSGKKGEATENVIVRPKIEISTSAKDKATDLNEGLAVEGDSQPKEEIILTDTVSYKDLVVGRNYTVKGILMDKATGLAFVDSTGKKIVAEKTFTAEQAKGSITLEFLVKKTDMRGRTVVVFEKLFEGEKEVAAHEDITDKNQTVNYPDLKTKAKDSDTGTNEGNATEQVTITDQVTYKNLVVGHTYKVSGVLMDKATGKPLLTLEGKEVHAEKKFVADKSNGTVDLVFVITKDDLAGKTIVVFEKLYNQEKEVGSHTDIEDEDQTVSYPKIRTKATETSIHGNTVTIEDTVSYELLTAGKQYKVEGILMDRETGQPFFVDKKEVTSSATFHAPNAKTGTVKVTFAFDRSVLKDNKKLVVFQRLYGSTGKQIAAHEDIDDENQTVEVKPIVKIETSAVDQESKMQEGLAKEEVKIKDTVSYHNLTVGQTYSVKGVLMDKATGNPFKNREGKEVHAEREFVAEQPNGIIELEFVVAKGDLAGKTVVVFESVYLEDKEVGTHADINDKNQSVSYPQIGTKASETSIHGNVVVLKDIVSYDNLTSGKEYKVTGVLMDKTTGESLKVEGKEIIGETVFTASKKQSGTVEVEFRFDRKVLKDPKNLVVFEKMYNTEEKLVGLHEDLEDKDQTVEVKPEIEIKTDAIDQGTEMEEGLANERVTIVDTISYKHLILGKNYTVKGILMDKATNQPFLTREGNKVQAEKTFKATQADGIIDLEFVIQRGDLAGKKVVVFETLYHDEKVVAAHTDIEDEAQTVSYPKVGTKASEITDSKDKEVVIKDLVSYENLIPGKEYQIVGTLMDKATGKAFKAGNDEVTGKTRFIASESGKGEVEVAFTFSRAYLNEETILVVFEKMYNVEGKIVGLHEDLEDDKQTIRQPQVSTKARDKETGTNEGFADEEVIIVDAVTYKNVEIGKEYTVKGILMDKATNRPLLTREKKEIHAEKTFIAQQREGTVELEFKITKGDLLGKTVVVFETLYREKKEVAAHTDIEDKEQSVHYSQVRTQALEISKDLDEIVVIKDLVYYENLLPGESYTVRGQLMMKEANKPFTVMGLVMESQKTFVASDTGKGTVEMTFVFRRSLLSSNLTIVVFERVFNAKGNRIGEHHDINDEAQTVTIKKENPELPNTKQTPFGKEQVVTTSYDRGMLPSTGEKLWTLAPYVGLLIIIPVTIVYFYRKRQRTK